MASPAVARHIKKVRKLGSKKICGPWNLFWLRSEKPGWTWNATCARGLGGAVERHAQERRARAVLRDLPKLADGESGFSLVLEWARPGTERSIKEGLGQVSKVIGTLITGPRKG